MDADLASAPRRLRLRFAVLTALALVLAAVAILAFLRHEARVRAEQTVGDHTQFIADSILREHLRAADFAAPVGGERREELDRLFADQVLHEGVVLTKLVAPSGVVTYSTDHRLIGRVLADAPDARRALAGEPERATKNLADAAEGPDMKVLVAAAAVRLSPDGPAAGVFELYRDYAPVAGEANDLVAPVAAALAIALLVLYVALFPILGRVTAAIEARSRRLGEQADALRQSLAERERSEQEAREAEARYRDLFENARDVIFTWDLDGRATDLNRAAEEVTGYSREELLGQHFTFILDPDQQAVARRQFELKRTGATDTTEFELRIRTKRGREVVLDVSSHTIREHGEPLGFQSICRDVTERRHAEETLRRSEEEYRLLFEANPQPMWVADTGTLAFLAVNDAAVAHYGYSREEFLAMTLRDIRPPEEVPALLAEFARPSAERSIDRVWRHRKKDGSEFDAEIRSGLLVVGGREARLVLSTDVSERQRLEEQLRQAQKMEAIGRLAGGIAHDFNNLLTGIMGYTELLLASTAAGDATHADLLEIRKAAERATELTRQLLAFSRRQVLQPRAVDLNAVVRELSAMLERLIGEDVALETSLDPRLRPVRADPGQLQQVLLNLAVNARDAMPRGGRLTIETANVALGARSASEAGVGAGQYVLLAVTDTGHGMDEETSSRAFEPFFTTKEEGRGTGLGLATVFGIVKQSGGHVSLWSRPGHGAVFRLYLPQADADPGPREAPPAAGGLLEGSEVILLAEDEELVRSLTCTILARAGYAVLTAESGERALALAASHPGPIHLLLTDTVMPGMSGPELAGRLLAVRPTTRVLYTSGYAGGAVVGRNVLGTGAPFLQKPFTPDALAAKVRAVLDGVEPAA